MHVREETFTLRFSLTATIPDRLWDEPEFEADDWLKEWEGAIKPALLQTVFKQLRSNPSWRAHVRNRGVSAQDEVEIVVEKVFADDLAATDD